MQEAQGMLDVSEAGGIMWDSPAVLVYPQCQSAGYITGLDGHEMVLS